MAPKLVPPHEVVHIQAIVLREILLTAILLNQNWTSQEAHSGLPVLQVANGHILHFEIYEYYISNESNAVNVSSWRSGIMLLVCCAEFESISGRNTIESLLVVRRVH